MMRANVMILLTFGVTAALTAKAATASDKSPAAPRSNASATIAGIKLSKATSTVVTAAALSTIGVASAPQDTDSPLVRAAKRGMAARAREDRSRIVIDSSTLLVSRTRSSSEMPAASMPALDSGRSYATGNQADAGAVASREQSEVARKAEAERVRVDTLRREQLYRNVQNQDYLPNDGEEDQIEKRLRQIPTEIANPPR